MSTTPPESPQTTTPPANYGIPGTMAGARLPVPGNAEFLFFFLIWIVIMIVWAASDVVGANDFVFSTTILGAAYLISRGIAKASRVLEH